MRTISKTITGKEHQQPISFDRILLEITNFEGFDAENEATWKKLLNRIDYGNKKTHRNEESTKELTVNREFKDKTQHHHLIPENKKNIQMKNYKQLLYNDNVVIIDKTPSKLRSIEDQDTKYVGTNSNPLQKSSKSSISSAEMPEPNTVRHFKDVFESLNLQTFPKDTAYKRSQNLGRSLSLPKNNEKKALQSKTLNLHSDEISKSNSFKEKCKKGKILNSDPLSSTFELSHNTMTFQTEEEERREWRNACSPVSPEVIQKIREHGISMTFFGRPAYSVSSSPTTNGSILSYDSEWPHSKILGLTKKYSERASSLGSSSTCSEDEYPMNMWENTEIHCKEEVFGNRYYYYSILNMHDHSEGNQTSPDDTYDIIYLKETYSRSSTPKLGVMNKGIWLKDPYWNGSFYIVYDFRDKDVQPHLALK